MNKTLEEMKGVVSNELFKKTKDTFIDPALSREEFDRINKEKVTLQDAITNCIYQNVKLKRLIKDHIKQIIEERYLLNDHNIDEVINFKDAKCIPSEVKFKIILDKISHDLEENVDSLNKQSLSVMIDKYKLDDIKNVDGDYRYVITKEEIDEIYTKEIKNALSYEEKIEIIVSLIYSRYKGYGPVEDLLEMNVDGINGGVSGWNEDSKENGVGLDSIWLIYKGKNIHLKFLTFDSPEELIRVCMNIYKFGSPGELSKADGYKINKMRDGSRVVVIRPNLCESWCFFIRKFHTKDMSIESLITHGNKEKLISLLKFITKGCNNICVSGQQGSGKTTMLLNLISFIYPVYPIRVSETCFELNLREKFPNRNICSLQETDEISGQRGLDLLKKTDGLINVIGEVASDEVATQLIQSGKVAARSTLFTHHAKTSEELIKSLRNSLLKTGVFKNEQVAEEEVASVIDFDVHLEKDFYGNRYIERVSECVYDYKTGKYEIVDLINFDADNKTYVLANCISDLKIKKIQKELTLEDRKEFEKFIEDSKCQTQQ